MKKAIIRFIPLVFLLIGLVFNVGCSSSNSGADISLEGLTLGAVTMEGKPVTGFPSDKINLLLEVSAQRVIVNYGAGGTVLTLITSGATVEIKPEGVVIKGVKPEQIKLEWATTK